MSIKKSLQSSMVLVASIPIIIFAALAIWIAFVNYMNVSRESIKTTAEDYQEGFSAQLNTQIVEVEAVANHNDIISLLLKKYNDPSTDLISDTASRSKIHQVLDQASDSFNDHVVYSVYDMDGRLTYSSDEHLIGEYSHYVEDMAVILDTIEINSTLSLNGKTNAIHILAPISVKDKYRVGILVASIDSEYFGSFISADNDTYLLDNTSNSLLGNELPDLDIQQKAVATLIQYDGVSASSGSILIRDGLSVSLYGYSIIPEYHWIYLVRQNMDMYESLLRSLLRITLILLVVFLFATIITSSKLAKKYCNPIFHLNDIMLQATKGNLNVHCEIESDDEFGELSRYFNDMMQIISNNYNELTVAKNQLEKNQKELQKNYKRIEQLAYTDTLTGLANRTAFMEQAHNLFHKSDSHTQRAILFIDLDNFKTVNDTLGHDYGDLLLQQIAASLSSSMSENDILARTGGDEFLVLRSHVTTTEELEEFASKLITVLNQPFNLKGEIVHVSMSMGVSIFPQNGLTVNELIKNADIAMYSAKMTGKNGFRFFNSTMEDEINYKNEIEEVLYSAIDNREVYLVYQPQCDMATGRITGCEALMRLRNGYLGQIPPAEFIPIAEESGIINELGTWAMEQACDFNRQLIEAGYGPLTMSVNVSIDQLKDPEFINQTKEILKRTRLSPQYLEIEITESVFMQSFESNASLFHELRDLGIRIALDDFGTGYSSFNYLTQMPIDTLKMDKSFVDNISANSKDRFVAETIISLAHKLGISVVAEGVETSDQLRILKENECDILQGYLFSKPLPDEYYRNLLELNQTV